MSRHNDNTRLRHMLEATKEALSIIRGKQRRDLESDRILELALTRLLEVIGEAANRVSESKRDSTPGIPWRQIIGLRNRLIHGYDAVDLDILWDIVHLDLPPLILALEKVVGED